MKKYLALAIVFVTIFSVAQSQHINIGIKGGLNIYTVNGSNYYKNTQQLAFNLGLLGHIHLSKRHALQPELVYSVEGFKYESGGSKVDVQLRYVNVPVLFQYMFDNGFRLELGPQLGFLQNAKSREDGTSTNVSYKYQRTELGIAGGFSYVNPPTGLGIDLRYNHGLSDINRGSYYESFNRGVQLGLFYLFQHRT
ncbi:MAG: porin family protein [Saprospiraceae bacterium]